MRARFTLFTALKPDRTPDNKAVLRSRWSDEQHRPGPPAPPPQAPQNRLAHCHGAVCSWVSDRPPGPSSTFPPSLSSSKPCGWLPIRWIRVTSAKQALLGQVANFTGIWTDLTGEAYQLGERASSLTTEFSLTQIEAGLNTRRTNEQNAWPTAIDVQNAYAGEDATVIQQVLDAHQTATAKRDAERNAWYDSQIVIAEAGEFLEAIESTASTQNSETTQGLGRTA